MLAIVRAVWLSLMSGRCPPYWGPEGRVGAPQPPVLSGLPIGGLFACPLSIAGLVVGRSNPGLGRAIAGLSTDGASVGVLPPGELGLAICCAGLAVGGAGRAVGCAIAGAICTGRASSCAGRAVGCAGLTVGWAGLAVDCTGREVGGAGCAVGRASVCAGRAVGCASLAVGWSGLAVGCTGWEAGGAGRAVCRSSSGLPGRAVGCAGREVGRAGRAVCRSSSGLSGREAFRWAKSEWGNPANVNPNNKEIMSCLYIESSFLRFQWG